MLHSLYGSTEVAYAAVATPDDLRADPRHRRPRAARRHAAGGRRRRAATSPPGETGPGLRRQRPRLRRLHRRLRQGPPRRRSSPPATSARSTPQGRLTVLGRDDDMVVVGGENVFTGSVEDALAGHPAVVEAAVVGVPDEQYGSRLVAHVVARGEVRPRRSCRTTCARGWPASPCRARCTSSTSCRATPPARSSSGTWRGAVTAPGPARPARGRRASRGRPARGSPSSGTTPSTS